MTSKIEMKLKYELIASNSFDSHLVGVDDTM